MRLLRCAWASAVLTILPLALASCYAETEPATNVMDDAVNLNAKVEWEQGEAGSYWFEYRPVIPRPGDPDGGWMQTEHRSFGPMPNSGGPVAVSEKLRLDCEDVEGSCSKVTKTSGPRTLTPSQQYEYKFCGVLTASPNPALPTPISRCWASAADPPPSDPPPPQPGYDTFRTLEAWDEPSHEQPVPCPVTSPTGWTCYEPEGPSTQTPTPYSAHYTNTFIFGSGPVTYGAFVHGRDMVFNGSRAQIFQGGNYLYGVGLRHDFRMKVYRSIGHDDEVDSFRNIVPDTGFSKSNALSGSFFVRHRRRGPYHVHFRDYVTASGTRNPNRADGLWVTPITATPYYYCDLNEDGNRICKFPD